MCTVVLGHPLDVKCQIVQEGNEVELTKTAEPRCAQGASGFQSWTSEAECGLVV